MDPITGDIFSKDFQKFVLQIPFTNDVYLAEEVRSKFEEKIKNSQKIVKETSKNKKEDNQKKDDEKPKPFS